MLAAVPWGLGWMIFGAREFLNTDVMLAGVAVIGVIGLALGEARVPAARTVHRRSLGDDDEHRRQRHTCSHDIGSGGSARATSAYRAD